MQVRPQTFYRITCGPSQALPDTQSFIATLNSLETGGAESASLFNATAELVIARAPGRLDVMGGIADYSGSLVLELPIAEATYVAFQKAQDRTLKIVSLSPDRSRGVSFEMSLAELERNYEPIEYDEACRNFKSETNQHWAAYVAGVFLVLMRERRLRFDGGARLLISSRVPEGKGVSSSAALEVATMSAVAAGYDIKIDAREIALLCQKVENLVVGAPCGVMDQMTSACGEANKFLALLCQPAELLGTVSLPENLTVWGLDSGVRHSVSGSEYGSVRVGTFIGYRIIAELAGLKISKEGDRVRIEDNLWQGYLANVSPSEFENYVERLPDKMRGSDFIQRYSGTTDPVTRIDPEQTYAVRVPVAHAVYESFRVRAFAELLSLRKGTADRQTAELLGELMYQSHASYSDCGLGSAGTDALVELVKKAGPEKGLFGAKITGGGSGGAVAVLGEQTAAGEIEVVAQRYADETGHCPYIFRGSSPGSDSFGHLRAKRTEVAN